VLIGAIGAGVAAVGEAMLRADRFGLPGGTGQDSDGEQSLAGVARSRVRRGQRLRPGSRAKDILLGLTETELTISRAVLDTLMAYPEAMDEDLGRIVERMRFARS
jgi:hypothetical protein